MKDIIEQLEEGKKNQQNGDIDKDSLYTHLESTEQQNSASEEKPEDSQTEDSSGFNLFKEAEQIIQDTAGTHEISTIAKLTSSATVDKAPLEDPDFDFHDFYETGRTVYFIRKLDKLGVKELLTLNLRSVYSRMLIGTEGKKGCVCVGYDARDLIFTDLKTAKHEFNKIHMKEVHYTTDDEVQNELKGIIEDTEEESEDYIGNEQETAVNLEED